MEFSFPWLLLFWVAMIGVKAANTAKSTERKYIIKWVGLKVNDNVKKLVPECHVDIKNTEDGLITMNGTLFLAEEIPDETHVKVLGFQKNMDGKSWQISPSLTYSYIVGNFIKTDQSFVMPAIVAGSDLQRNDSLKKRLYTLKNVKLGDGFPASMNGANWLFTLDWMMVNNRPINLGVEIFFDSRAQPAMKPKKPGMG